MTIYVCVGSGCHLKGSYDIIHLLKDKVKTHQLESTIELKASFCLGHCMAGVTLKVDEEIITGFNKENFNMLFESRILPKLKGV